MRFLKFLLLICLLGIAFTGCAEVGSVNTELPPETIEIVTVKFAADAPKQTVPAAVEPIATVRMATEAVPSTALTVTEAEVTEAKATEATSTEPIGSTTAVLTESAEPKPESVMVPILMFHDVKTYAGGTWSISAENFRDKMEFLTENGYTPVTFAQLVEYVDGAAPLPEKPVCITFDDGYYSNYKNVLPIITELNIPITVFVIGSMIRADGVEPDPNEDALSTMNTAEIAQMEASPLVQIQPHTYDLHIRGYGNSEKRGDVLPLQSESEFAYKQMFAADCALAESALTDAGVAEYTVFSYPGGAYHRWAEAVLRERGYRVTLTTNSGHRNLVVVGDPESLFLLGRMNVNDETTDKELLGYLCKK